MPTANLGKVRGDDGANVYIKYNSNAADAGASDSFNANVHKFVGIMTSTSKNKPESGYTWMKFIGEDGASGSNGITGATGAPGANGIDGTNGADGKSCYIKYSTTNSITGATDSWATGQAWIGFAFSNAKTAPTDNESYRWSKFIDDTKLDKMQVLNIVYPVGSIYESTVNICPGTFIGGVWVSFGEGCTLIGSGKTYPAGDTGGKSEYILTENQIPQHNGHIDALGGGNDEAAGRYHPIWDLKVFETGGHGWSCQAGNEAIPAHKNFGGNAPIDNMPPYIVVYRWRRES